MVRKNRISRRNMMGSNQMTFERYEKKYLLDEIQYKEFIKRTRTNTGQPPYAISILTHRTPGLSAHLLKSRSIKKSCGSAVTGHPERMGLYFWN